MLPNAGPSSSNTIAFDALSVAQVPFPLAHLFSPKRKDSKICVGRLPIPLRCWVIVFYVLTLITPTAWAGDDWLPIKPKELEMTSDPDAPSAPAIYLYRQVDRNDATFYEFHYDRIKIFNEEGRKYADIEIPFIKGYTNIRNIEARSIHSDGMIINFNGQIYDKMIAKARGIKYLAKTFTIADVQVGGIIEYRYTLALPKYPTDSRWLLSGDLFTKHANFSIRRNDYFAIQWSWPRGLPSGANRPVQDHALIRMEADNLPAFQTEDYMPPPEEMKYRVEFAYSFRLEKDPDKFWREEGKQLEVVTQRFIDRRKAMEQALAQIISPSDTPELKLQKIYARCQKIRNTTFERDKTEQEQRRVKLKEAENVENVWKRGYGDGWDISWLFLALARTAGFDASPVLVSTRDQHFFNPKLMNPYDLNTNVVLVKLNGKDVYFDPGTAFTPFGLLPWYETGVAGLLIDKDGGAWIKTPVPDPAASGTDRNAALQLDESGTLEGKVRITYKGLSALSRRIDERDADDVARKKELEDELKSSVPGTPEVELINPPDWNSSSDSFVAEYHISVPGWASSAGLHRLLLPAGVFGGNEKHLFEATQRVHPIAFAHPYIDADDITITLPSGWVVESLPRPKPLDLIGGTYTLVTTERKDRTVHLDRRLMLNLTLVDPSNYGTLRDFYQGVRTGDEQQIVLASAAN
jgi:hypothetical protein